MAATYQRLSRGRLLLNVVTGGQPDEQRRFGDHLSHDARYARTAEFLAIVRGAWTGQQFDFSGEYYQVEGATVMRPPEPVPGVYFGGQVADLIEEYAALGISEFILSGYSHLEEAY
jgi:alkanesulfonate monooxygenase